MQIAQEVPTVLTRQLLLDNVNQMSSKIAALIFIPYSPPIRGDRPFYMLYHMFFASYIIAIMLDYYWLVQYWADHT